MKLFWQKVIANKSNPLYWPIVLILWLVSLGYRLLSTLNRNMTTTPVKLGIPVISVGNLTVGGAGKTPLVITLARLLIEKKYRVGIVARGYGRRTHENVFGSGADLNRRNVDDIGDEPLMMAELLPEAYFGIGSPKWKVARKLAERENLDVIIVDDGFQHCRLYRDSDIVAIDAGRDLYTEAIFPLGRLRESVKSLGRADVIVLTRINRPGVDNNFIARLEKAFPDKPIFKAAFNSTALISKDGSKPIESIAGKKVLAFSGIGDNKSFEESIRQFGPAQLKTLAFADHCRYEAGELDAILAEIKSLDPDLVLTTHKDYVKVRNYNLGRTVYYITVMPEIVSGADELVNLLEGIVRK